MNYKPVVIIGAPRSGTNMLRDVLAALPGMATWPCDEINYIWRHGNIRLPSDEMQPEQVTPHIERYIRRQFDWVAKRYDADTVIEKTCANSLRVEFVDRIVPEARYLFIRRDGMDAVGSALKRWKASMDWGYVLRKARFVPPSDLPYYGGRYLWNRLYRLVSRDERLAFWGPKMSDMEELLARYSLEQVCALQWKRCVDAASSAFNSMGTDRWMEVGYEDFVRTPGAGLDRVLDFLQVDAPSPDRQKAVEGVRASSIGKGRSQLDEETLAHLLPLVRDTMERFGYDTQLPANVLEGGI